MGSVGRRDRGEGGGGEGKGRGYELTGAEDVIALRVNGTIRAHDGGVHGARRHLKLHCRIPAQIALRWLYPQHIPAGTGSTIFSRNLEAKNMGQLISIRYGVMQSRSLMCPSYKKQ